MATMSKEALSPKPYKDLYKLASELKIRGRSKKNKKDLIDLIIAYGSTVKELRQEAKEKEIKGVWKLQKQELFDLLKNNIIEPKNASKNQQDQHHPTRNHNQTDRI